jgi:hypothetical protein
MAVTVRAILVLIGLCSNERYRSRRKVKACGEEREAII